MDLAIGNFELSFYPPIVGKAVSNCEQWHREKTGYVIGSQGDDQEMNHTAFSHLCWVDNIWLFARHTTTLQTMLEGVTHSMQHNLGMH